MGKLASIILAIANVWLAVASSSSFLPKYSGNALVRHFEEHWAQYYLALLLLSLVFFLLGIREHRARNRLLLKQILDMAIEHDLPQGQYDDQECKATLYRYSGVNVLAAIRHWHVWKQWCWPWHGWLVPLVRSGENALGFWDQTVFRASPRQASGNYHGVAGAVWAKGFHSHKSEAAPSDGRKLAAYEKQNAKGMYLSDLEYDLRKRSGRALSPHIYGSRIEISGKKRWGVIVIDSSVEPRVLKEVSPNQTDLLIVGVLSRAIEWGEL